MFFQNEKQQSYTLLIRVDTSLGLHLTALTKAGLLIYVRATHTVKSLLATQTTGTTRGLWRIGSTASDAGGLFVPLRHSVIQPSGLKS